MSFLSLFYKLRSDGLFIGIYYSTGILAIVSGTIYLKLHFKIKHNC